MEVVRLYYGSMDGPLGPATPWQGYAIKHPQGVVLVDTGFGPTFGEGQAGELNPPSMPEPPHWRWVRRSTIEALADHGLHPADVKYIVNTHLIFKHAQFIIQAPEAEYARKRHEHVRAQWDFPGARIEQLACEDVEVLPGVTCLFTPGHTPGHQSILVDDGTTRTLLVGDAVYTAEIFDDIDSMEPGHLVWPWQVEPEVGLEVWRSSARKLQAVDADVMHFSHERGAGHNRR
jgi:glyoxylase-like metal-dependent hydrolase (beta-lactamase superfamily II)